MRRSLNFIIAFLFILTSPLSAANDFYEKSKEGWHWYIDPKKSSQDNNRTTEDDIFIASLPEDFTTMTAEEFKLAEEKARAISVMKPTQTNIMAWKRMVKFATDQSKLFTVNLKLASMMDDQYEYTDIGTGNFSHKAMAEEKTRREKAKFLTENIVFVTFVKDGAGKLTQRQIIANMDLKRDFGVDSRTFAVEDYPETAKELGVRDDVENFVFYKDTKKWQRIKMIWRVDV